MPKIGIYGWHNLANGKWYIGQSIVVMKRKRRHLTELRKGEHGNEYFQRAFIKYGEDGFRFVILEETTKDLLDIREVWWINFYKSNIPKFGYNSDSGGHKEKHHSAEVNHRISETHLIENLSLETRRKMSEARLNSSGYMESMKKLHKGNTGSHRTLESRQKISNSLKGKPLSIEHKKALSNAKKGRPFPLKASLKAWAKRRGSHLSEEHRRRISEAHHKRTLKLKIEKEQVT